MSVLVLRACLAAWLTRVTVGEIQGLGDALDYDGFECTVGIEDCSLQLLQRRGRLAGSAEKEVPLPAKAFAQVFKGSHGLSRKFNTKLKLFLTSGGFTSTGTATQRDAYLSVAKDSAGDGVLFLLDAKMLTLQHHLIFTDPKVHNQEKLVSYHREPDQPGGKPVYDEEGKLIMKSHAELLKQHTVNFPYWLRHRGEFSNFELSIIAGSDTDKAVPVYFAYLWYTGEVNEGNPEYKILLGEGFSKGGKFAAKKVDGTVFSDADYETPWASKLDSEETHMFRSVSATEFAELVPSLKTVVACGGDTFLTVRSLQPFFRDAAGNELTAHPNPYGQAILDAMKSGEIIYLGQSAGTVAMSWMVGPLTADPSTVLIRMNDTATTNLSLGMNHQLGKSWMFPDLGKYIGMPYQLVLRPHLTMQLDWDHSPPVALKGETSKHELGLEVLSSILKASPGAFLHDVWAVIMYDYDWSEGKSDLLEITNGRIRFHVGYAGDEVFRLGSEAAAELRKLHPDFVAKCKLDANGQPELLRQPPGNPEAGWTLDWTPEDGEVIAAGPLAKRPFRLYTSSNGFLADAPPYVDQSS